MFRNKNQLHGKLSFGDVVVIVGILLGVETMSIWNGDRDSMSHRNFSTQLSNDSFHLGLLALDGIQKEILIHANANSIVCR